MTQPPPPQRPGGPEDPTIVETVEPYPPGRRVVVDEAPPRRDIWPWLLAALLAALAIIFFVLWWTNRDKGPHTARVPNLVGMKEQQAQAEASARGFSVKTIARTAFNPAGTVLDQAPDPGNALSKGGRMIIVVSTGRPQTAVPQVTGLKVEAAKRVLTTAKLSPQVQIVPSNKPAGTVLSQDPTSGTKVANGADVLLSVSKGPKLVTVPALQGLSVDTATQRLAAVGLVPTVIQVASAEPQGTVIAQDPPRDQKVKPGSKVRINVSRGSATTQSTTVVSVSTATTTVATTAPTP